MKTIQILACAISLLSAAPAIAQHKPSAQYHGAQASAQAYQVVYQLNSDDEKIINATLKNIRNALADPRLKGKVQVELVVHGGGVAAFRKDQPYESQLRNLEKQGVILAQCENTLKERNISKDELIDFIGFVPSGNGELIIRQQQGWAIIHP